MITESTTVTVEVPLPSGGGNILRMTGLSRSDAEWVERRLAPELVGDEAKSPWRIIGIDRPLESGRYIVSHAGGVGGSAYYTAHEGDTGYPVGWSQMPSFQPTHWLDMKGPSEDRLQCSSLISRSAGK